MDAQHPAGPGHRTSPVSFSRRGTRLTERQQSTWDALADRFVLDVPRAAADTSVDPDAELDVATAFGRTAPLVVEIGTGRGEALCVAAERAPGWNFLGLEVWTPGVAQALMMVRSRGLTNVRLAVVNAPEALGTWLPAGSVRELRLWFPDPWHKTKHHKRRLVTDEFTHLVHRVLEPGGVWRMATDWADYARQMADVVGASRVVDGGPCERFAGRPETKFEAKGIAVGRTIHDLAARPVR